MLNTLAQEGILYNSERKYSNRAEQNERVYPPLELKIKELSTAVLLLSSKEGHINLEMLHSLSSYLGRSEDNRLDAGICSGKTAGKFVRDHQIFLFRGLL